MKDEKLFRILKTLKNVEDLDYGKIIIHINSGRQMSMEIIKTVAKPLNIVVD